MALYADGLIEGFAWDPGAHANYEYGTNEMLGGCAHITAGSCLGDRAILLRGYANTYGPKSPDCGPGRCQFSYLDSADWGACEWNAYLTHYEMEKENVDEDAELYQLESAGLWVRKLIALKVVSSDPEYRDTPDDRIAVGNVAAVTGIVVTHRSLHEIACDQHSDGWPQKEWLVIKSIATGGSPSPVPIPKPKETPEMGSGVHLDNGTELGVGLGDDGSFVASHKAPGETTFTLVIYDGQDLPGHASPALKFALVPELVQNGDEARLWGYGTGRDRYFGTWDPATKRWVVEGLGGSFKVPAGPLPPAP